MSLQYLFFLIGAINADYNTLLLKAFITRYNKQEWNSIVSIFSDQNMENLRYDKQEKKYKQVYAMEGKIIDIIYMGDQGDDNQLSFVVFNNTLSVSELRIESYKKQILRLNFSSNAPSQSLLRRLVDTESVLVRGGQILENTRQSHKYQPLSDVITYQFITLEFANQAIAGKIDQLKIVPKSDLERFNIPQFDFNFSNMIPDLSLLELVRYMLSTKHQKQHIAEYLVEQLGLENILKTCKEIGFDVTGIHYPLSFQIFLSALEQQNIQMVRSRKEASPLVLDIHTKLKDGSLHRDEIKPLQQTNQSLFQDTINFHHKITTISLAIGMSNIYSGNFKLSSGVDSKMVSDLFLRLQVPYTKIKPFVDGHLDTLIPNQLIQKNFKYMLNAQEYIGGSSLFYGTSIACSNNRNKTTCFALTAKSLNSIQIESMMQAAEKGNIFLLTSEKFLLNYIKRTQQT